jgi:hypothetical protein
MPKTWLPVVGYEGIYEVSCSGIVRRSSLAKTGGHKRGKVMRVSVPKNGYPVVKLSKDGKCTTCLLHRVVAQAFVPNPDNKPEVNHKDGNIANYIARNLEWTTRGENVKHSFRVLGRKRPRGESCGTAKLTAQIVIAIRKGHANGVLQRDLASQFGVSAKQISVIVNRVQWAHI